MPLDRWVSFAREESGSGAARSFSQAAVYLDRLVTYGDESRLPLPRRAIARLGPAALARLAQVVSDPRLRCWPRTLARAT